MNNKFKYKMIVFVLSNELNKTEKDKIKFSFNKINANKINKKLIEYNHSKFLLKKNEYESNNLLFLKNVRYNEDEIFVVFFDKNNKISNASTINILEKIPLDLVKEIYFKNGEIIYINESRIPKLWYINSENKGPRPYIIYEKRTSTNGFQIMPLTSRYKKEKKSNGENIIFDKLSKHKKIWIECNEFKGKKKSLYVIDKIHTLDSSDRKNVWYISSNRRTIDKEEIKIIYEKIIEINSEKIQKLNI